jgi:tetratricopeptide (TPR) repeat protein
MQNENRTWALYVSIAVLVFPLLYLLLKNNPVVAEEQPVKTVVIARPVLADSLEIRFNTLITNGLSTLNEKEFDKSILLFVDALKIKPASEIALNDLGFVFCQKREFDKGAAYFRQALAIKPDFQLAKNNLAWAVSELSKKQ